MNRVVRLSWDFFGPESKRTAQHFVEHLGEFLRKHELTYAPRLELHEGATSVHLESTETDAAQLRSALRPRRVEVFDSEIAPAEDPSAS